MNTYNETFNYLVNQADQNPNNVTIGIIGLDSENFQDSTGVISNLPDIEMFYSLKDSDLIAVLSSFTNHEQINQALHDINQGYNTIDTLEELINNDETNYIVITGKDKHDLVGQYMEFLENINL